MLRILGRIARALAVTIWFGIWFLGPAVLLYMGFDDPRDPFPDLFSAIGCGMLAFGWLYISVYFAICDQLPEFMTVP
jgi:hypothetical protein